ncbi:hypothetical protein ACIPY1_16330 [Paenarthrobacter nicotinovorans]|uniref:hypothetical protein n=2 Tax=Paenarthrobacter nicotinovorans TaxID=29320 RepID=UPI002782D245|nr:hypothetical protein [Paenarthrobacter nicotinovorans]MDP9935143.1 vacuolar-type H+-ATPase subunit I/STV1 [Paenarthrobacter nicotinovorans]
MRNELIKSLGDLMKKISYAGLSIGLLMILVGWILDMYALLGSLGPLVMKAGVGILVAALALLMWRGLRIYNERLDT